MNLPIEEKQLYSFDGFQSVRGQVVYPEKQRDLQVLNKFTGNMIPRGAGLSYSLASADKDVLSISSEGFNRILEFKAATQTVLVESGVSFGQLLKFLYAKNRWLHPIPGYPDITIGGAIGFNVHGKSQFQSGVFADWVESITLLQPEKGLTTASRFENSELFELTMGGMGLTGFILQAEIRTVPLPDKSIQRKRHKIQNFDQALALFKNPDSNVALFSWHTFKDGRFGAGFVYEDSFSPIEVRAKAFKWKGLHHPPRTSAFFDRLKVLATRLVPFVYGIQESLRPSIATLDIFTAAFPFVGKEIYHNLFGRSGVLEYQLLIPMDRLNKFLHELEVRVKDLEIRPTMVSLKRFRGQRKFLTFNGDGLCLSIDVLNSRHSLKFFAALDFLCTKYGCLPNISKDSRLPLKVIKATYGVEYELFKTQIEKLALPFSSALSRKLGLNIEPLPEPNANPGLEL